VTGVWQVGGLVGDNYGTVSNSYAAGIVTGEEWDAGGLVGANSGTVSDSYSTGSVTGNEYVGGLVGRNWRDVSNSYYNYDEALINGENVITIGALFNEDFEEWLANDKFLDVSERLSQEDGYYVVDDVADFKELLAFGQHDSLKFRLKNDLDLATEPNFYVPYLAGEFDGNGHKISNLSFNFGFVSSVGLFGYLDSGGTVHEVTAESVNITAGRDVGGLVGFSMGTVGNASSIGSVAGKYSVGGLVGYLWEGNVNNSDSTCTVTGSMQYIGGLVGHIWEGNVSNCYSTGSVTGFEYVGGLVGYDYYTIVSNSYSTSTVTGDSHVGGLVGDNYIGSTVSNSYFAGIVTGNDNVVGGLVGYNSGTITNSFATGLVTGTSDVGGLVGKNSSGTVTNSFYDKDTTGQTDTGKGTGLTTAVLMTQSTYAAAGWDFTNTWYMIDGETRPFLRSEYSTDIRNAHQLQLMVLNLSAGYTLADNIEMTELTQTSGHWKTAAGTATQKGFVAIGNSATPFTGAFDGQGHSITGLYINRPATDYVGLFGYINGAGVSNVGIANGSVTG